MKNYYLKKIVVAYISFCEFLGFSIVIGFVKLKLNIFFNLLLKSVGLFKFFSFLFLFSISVFTLTPDSFWFEPVQQLFPKFEVPNKINSKIDILVLMLYTVLFFIGISTFSFENMLIAPNINIVPELLVENAPPAECPSPSLGSELDNISKLKEESFLKKERNFFFIGGVLVVWICYFFTK